MSAITVTATYHTFIIQYFDAPSKQELCHNHNRDIALLLSFHDIFQLLESVADVSLVFFDVCKALDSVLHLPPLLCQGSNNCKPVPIPNSNPPGGVATSLLQQGGYLTKFWCKAE